MRIKKFMAIGLTAALCAAAPAAQILAAPVYDVQNEWNDAGGEDGTMELSGFQGQPGNTGGQSGGMGSNVTYADSPSEIITGTITTSASELTADEENAETIVMSDENSQVKIDSAGTYIVTGKCSDGNITVKKNTTGVVLILKDLDLTSTTGATVSCNKYSEVKIIIQGTVNLTDAEDPADEDSEDETTADAFDGAALKAKDGSSVYLTGTGTLNIDASSCKNGIKVGDEDTPAFVIDGDLTININAANDGINAGYDMTILSGTVNITAVDDGIHADRILTVGKGDGTGPVINIKKSEEGLEGTIVNLFGGSGTVNASDDAVNAANKDALYEGVLTYSINITGGTWTIKCSGDGLDSNGNVNITGGSVTISSASNGGEAGIDYDGALYVADGTLNNNSGVAGPDNMMGGGMQGQQPGTDRGSSGQRPGKQSGTQPGEEQENANRQPEEIPDLQNEEQQTPSQTGSGTSIVSKVFPDVADSSAPYFTPVYWAVNEGIVKGYSNGYFGPEDSCTRAQFVVMIWRLAGRPAASATVDFSDVSSDLSYYNAIQWAVEQGIIKGFSDGTFRPDDTVTREQTAIMLWRMAGKPSASKQTSFTDVSASDSNYAAVMWGSEAGLIKGFADGSFGPEQDCLRQQIVIFLYRYAKNILGENV